MDLDDPRNTLLRRRIIREKSFLRHTYEEWYSLICSRLPPGANSIVELGSGAGFLSEVAPNVTTSEVFPLDGIDRVEDATSLSFADGSLDAIVMTDVLHHIPDVGAFFGEASRTLRPGGRLVMIEPWRTPWANWVYTHLHHEPFRPEEEEWGLPLGGPLSMANGALPWIVFSRDLDVLKREHPALVVKSIEPLMPIAYLASGGVSMRALLPGRAYRVVRLVEKRLLRERGAMFALIEVHRVAH